MALQTHDPLILQKAMSVLHLYILVFHEMDNYDQLKMKKKMFNVCNRNTRKNCLKLTIKAPKQRQ